MVIPIYDSDPLDRNPWAVVTWSLIAINIVVFLFELNASESTDLIMIAISDQVTTAHGFRSSGSLS